MFVDRTGRGVCYIMVTPLSAKLKQLKAQLAEITPELIGLLRERPVLWDTSRPNFYDLPKRAELWREVTRELFICYDGCSADEKKYLTHLVKTRWKYVRTAFVRYKKKCGHTGSRYIYDEALSFYKIQSRSNYTTFNGSFDEECRKSSEHEREKDLDEVKTRKNKNKVEKRRKSPEQESEEQDLDDDQCFFDSLKPALRDLTSSERSFFQTNVTNILTDLLYTLN